MIGIIYKIEAIESGDIYIGSTMQPFETRMKYHEGPYNKTRSKIVIDQIYYSKIIIRKVYRGECNDKPEIFLKKIEQYYHDLFKKKLVNNNKAYLTPEEKENYQAKWRVKNIEKARNLDRNSKLCLCGGKIKLNRPYKHLDSIRHKEWANRNDNKIEFHARFKNDLFWNKRPRKIDIPLDDIVFLENVFLPPESDESNESDESDENDENVLLLENIFITENEY